ncbi:MULTISPECIES: hypothetical protein [Halobacteriovorax]|uniref:hypothetical protein n=1 Tax=Halobacteriovorax TaxID=1652133 RepID=UPI001314547B|nr:MULTISPECIES: hypothetical protein [Halobacteriovorax]
MTNSFVNLDFGYREEGLDITLGFEKLISGDINISGTSNEIDLFKFVVDAGFSF